ncbi:hypothetical protein AMTR_s00117p00028900 [Amborella trichopoda]|uniref:Uncharacterized protein n=1 Tax=Amborella trichopoda TaxID=13333 RepID=W1NSU6_AMBTC|nr:hypothetical protein AMTR_s00117p00028900 [Amborella trichopoda]
MAAVLPPGSARGCSEGEHATASRVETRRLGEAKRGGNEEKWWLNFGWRKKVGQRVIVVIGRKKREGRER